MMYFFRKITLALFCSFVVMGPLSAQEIVDGQMASSGIPQVDNDMQLLDLEAGQEMQPLGAVEGSQGGGGISFSV